jgi:ABC-type glycerol-3-phosphate transport system substrate-binding protein
MMKRLVLLVGIALLSFAFAAAASAASAKTPFHGSFHDDLSFNYACPGTVLLH